MTKHNNKPFQKHKMQVFAIVENSVAAVYDEKDFVACVS